MSHSTLGQHVLYSNGSCQVIKALPGGCQRLLSCLVIAAVHQVLEPAEIAGGRMMLVHAAVFDPTHLSILSDTAASDDMTVGYDETRVSY